MTTSFLNYRDPMTLDGRTRDWFPKRDLLDGWIGDRYPLCSDLPAKHFLKTGELTFDRLLFFSKSNGFMI